ncbi:MAG TPA: hypothetical protein VGK36_05460 [Candidatus Angelobacter sp.]|jgi:hypothetical protein
MQELRDYYRKRLKWMLAPIVSFAILYRQFAVPAIHNWYHSHGFTFGESWLEGAYSLMIGFFFLAGEWLIRTRLWKLEKPWLNFSGLWEGETKYQVMEKGSDKIDPQTFQPFSSKHEVKIEQDCFSISIKPTDKTFATWYSITMTVRNAEEVAYAYEVKYADETPRFPAKAIGYEQMSVTLRKKGWFGIRKDRPIRLSGTFAHCAEGQTPVYRGNVTFQFQKN